MEQSPLGILLKTIKNPQPLASFTAPIRMVQVRLYTTTGQKDIRLKGLAPFHTLDDLQRTLWLQTGKSDELFPAYTYISYQNEGQEIPAMFIYTDPSKTEEPIIQVPNPATILPAGEIQHAFVDENGDPTNPVVMKRGRVTLQDAFLTPYGQLPPLSVYSFSYLLSLFRGPKAPLSSLNWYGLFYPYFPHLTANTTGQLTAGDRQQKQLLETYSLGKIQQVQLLERLLTAVALPELQTTGVKYLQFQWVNKEREAYFDGVDTLFFSQSVNAVRPFMRLLTPNATAMSKLFQPNPLEPPTVNDPATLKTWVSEENPISDSSVLFVKAVVRRGEFGYHPLYSTLRVLDDTTADFTVETPKDQRIMDFSRDLRNLESALIASAEGMPFDVQSIQLGKAHLRIELHFESAPDKKIRKIVQTRMAQLTSLFQETDPEASEQTVFASYRYKGVSNFTTPNRIFSFLNYAMTRKQIGREGLAALIPELAAEFEITQEKAQSYITEFLQQTQEMTVKDTDATEFLVKSNPGVDVSISAYSVTSFILNLYNIRQCTVEDIQRICSAISLAFYATEAQWDAALEESGIKQGAAQQTAIAADVVEPAAERVEERVIRAAPPRARIILPGEEDDGDEEEEGEGEKSPEKKEDAADQKIIVDRWFNERLKQLDKTLFGYTPGKGGKNYSRKCPPAQDRYPFTLTLQQYQNMRKIYAAKEAKNEVAFIEYGTPDTAKSIEAAKKALEKITVLRYGSDPTPKNLLYFLCHSILCLRDLLPILQEDWKSDTDYAGKKKAPNSCPFCHGTEFKDRENPQPGETVFIRRKKPNVHGWVRFLSDPEHPNGYELPCCFVSRKDIPWEDPRFDRIRQAPDQPPLAVDEAVQEKAAENVQKTAELRESLAVREQLDVPYDIIRWKIAKDYILGTEKYPLEPGKVGLLSPALDAFFGQSSSAMVSRVAIKQEFLPTAHGFFRIGVNNKVSYLNNSLFAALAPMLGLNTVNAVQDYLVNRITPRVFITLNFGNLVLEFYDPKQKDVPGPVLMNWAQTHLRNKNMTKTMFELNRFYNAYHNFIAYIQNDAKRKQLRHFVHALAEPGLLTIYGLSLITLHYKGDPRDAKTQIEVLCPMMGFDMDRYSNNTIGFLTFSDQKIWEPLLYVDKLNQYGTAKSEVYYTITQAMMERPTFPTLVKNRYQDEYLYKCAAAYRGAFTLQSDVDTRALVPLSKALDILAPYKPTGLVRDVYNHTVAITLQNPTGKSNYVLVPVVDDGNTFHTSTGLQIHLGLSSIDLAPANDVYICYEQIVSPSLYPLSTVYKLHNFVAIDGSIVAFELGGPDAYASILLPCGSIKPGNGAAIPPEMIDDASAKRITSEGGFQFEYLINNEIIKHIRDEKEYMMDESSFLIQRKQADILYEHLRLSFSKWIADESSSELRTQIESIIQYRPVRLNIPTGPVYSKYEKMQQLRIRIGSTLERWFEMDDQDIDIKNILIKKDCIAIREERGKCTEGCIFDEDEETCKIHAPTTVPVASNPNPRSLPAARYFVDRLLDELIRLPARRNELLTGSIQRIQVPATNIHIGTQWILPENTPAWYDLLRGSSQEGLEAPEYYEEFGREDVSEDEMDEIQQGRALYPIPDRLAALLPETLKQELAIEVIGNPDTSRAKSIRRYFGITTPLPKGASDIDLTSITLLEISKKYKMPVIQIQVTKDPLVPLGRVDDSIPIAKTGAYVILPDFEEGPAILVRQHDVTDVIPSIYLKGTLLDSIKPLAVIKRRVLPRPVLNSSNSNSNSNSSGSVD